MQRRTLASWRISLLVMVVLVSMPVGAPAQSERTPAPEGVRLYFISPKDDAKLASPVAVRFGLSGMGVAPAGVAYPNTGHHHLLVDAEVPPVDRPVPADEHHIHFGAGQTEVRLELAPGRHTLQLLLGDHNHVPHDPPVVSERISITVK